MPNKFTGKQKTFLTLNSNEIVSPTADVECFYIDAPTTEYRRYKIKGDFNNLKDP
jgi:hypothetical protein